MTFSNAHALASQHSEMRNVIRPCVVLTVCQDGLSRPGASPSNSNITVDIPFKHITVFHCVACSLLVAADVVVIDYRSSRTHDAPCMHRLSIPGNGSPTPYIYKYICVIKVGERSRSVKGQG